MPSPARLSGRTDDPDAPDWTRAARDYAAIEHAIRLIDADRDEPPDLRAIAHGIGQSVDRTRRLVRSWSGVGATRFLCYVTAEHARERLRAGQSALDALLAADAVPDRQHDSPFGVETITPDAVRRAAASLTVAWGIHPSPFGDVLVLATGGAVCGLDVMGDPAEGERLLAEARAAWPKCRLVADPHGTASLAARAFALDASRPPVLLQGTPFQVAVWTAAMRVPPGALAGYADLARLIGAPRAQKAVGQAMARAKVSFLVPCHRILRSDGTYSGVARHRLRRQAMVAWEAARLEARTGGSEAATAPAIATQC